MTDCAPDGCGPVRPARSIAPPAFGPADARDTTTPIAAFGSADPDCALYGPRYFADESAFDRYLASGLAQRSDTVYRWDLDRTTGTWTPAAPIYR